MARASAAGRWSAASRGVTRSSNAAISPGDDGPGSGFGVNGFAGSTSESRVAKSPTRCDPSNGCTAFLSRLSRVSSPSPTVMLSESSSSSTRCTGSAGGSGTRAVAGGLARNGCAMSSAMSARISVRTARTTYCFQTDDLRLLASVLRSK